MTHHVMSSSSSSSSSEDGEDGEFVDHPVLALGAAEDDALGAVVHHAGAVGPGALRGHALDVDALPRGKARGARLQEEHVRRLVGAAMAPGPGPARAPLAAKGKAKDRGAAAKDNLPVARHLPAHVVEARRGQLVALVPLPLAVAGAAAVPLPAAALPLLPPPGRGGVVRRSGGGGGGGNGGGGGRPRVSAALARSLGLQLGPLGLLQADVDDEGRVVARPDGADVRDAAKGHHPCPLDGDQRVADAGGRLPARLDLPPRQPHGGVSAHRVQALRPGRLPLLLLAALLGVPTAPRRAATTRSASASASAAA
mmetsp:Transcript_6866/g.17763  ORF Transcript_6866/g.17763 Transcript_6866/m.17763 type:complete len:311 (+) Transcript_6866:84-1016(+)